MKKAAGDSPQTLLLDRCQEITTHVALLRDYASTPGNVWLARSELSRISEMLGELDRLLEAINREGTV